MNLKLLTHITTIFLLLALSLNLASSQAAVIVEHSSQDYFDTDLPEQKISNQRLNEKSRNMVARTLEQTLNFNSTLEFPKYNPLPRKQIYKYFNRHELCFLPPPSLLLKS